ncbi:hypothetical protein H0H93_010988 [Arthromyces matolae]|nr:hypothetical protein H0H93_010988 [Arthromyces matolae]
MFRRGIYAFLTGNDALTRKDNHIVISPYTGSPNQQWAVDVTPGYHITLAVPGSPKCYLAYMGASKGESLKPQTPVVVELFGETFPPTAWTYRDIENFNDNLRVSDSEFGIGYIKDNAVGIVEDEQIEFDLKEIQAPEL